MKGSETAKNGDDVLRAIKGTKFTPKRDRAESAIGAQIVAKRNKVFNIAFCGVLAVLEAVAFYLCAASATAPVALGEENALTIVLDAGHGGIDGGVSGKKTGVKESDINLSITFLAAKKFRDAGFDVTLTRKTEAGLYGTATQGFKRRDMQKRKEIIQSARPAAVVSVHQNYYPSSFSRGGQAFYAKGNEEGEKLAKEVQKAFNALYGARRVKKRTHAAGDFFMLSCAECPSVLVECGFLSNAADEALLRSDTFQNEAAEAIVAGVLAYFAAVSA